MTVDCSDSDIHTYSVCRICVWRLYMILILIISHEAAEQNLKTPNQLLSCCTFYSGPLLPPFLTRVMMSHFNVFSVYISWEVCFSL
ncbi:hypothetical protein AOLI_G00324310 [Acnodon oligacanthus]